MEVNGARKYYSVQPILEPLLLEIAELRWQANVQADPFFC